KASEVVTTLVHVRMLAAREATEGVVPKATLMEMFVCQAREHMVVHADACQSQPRKPAAQVHCRQPRRLHRPCHAAIVDARENAVSLPLSQPRRRRLAQALRP